MSVSKTHIVGKPHGSTNHWAILKELPREKVAFSDFSWDPCKNRRNWLWNEKKFDHRQIVNKGDPGKAVWCVSWPPHPTPTTRESLIWWTLVDFSDLSTQNSLFSFIKSNNFGLPSAIYFSKRADAHILGAYIARGFKSLSNELRMGGFAFLSIEKSGF